MIVRFLFLLVLFISNAQYGQQLNPSIKNYSINDYNADNQNWGIDVDDNGVVFVANNKGLLRYNGQKWTLFNLPNNTIIRSVLCLDNKIYTGSYEEFGFWEKDAFGNYKYTSLTSLFLKDFEFTSDEIWQIIPYKESIIFRSFSRLYIYNGKSIKIIEDSENILNLVVYQNNLIANSILRGLLFLNDANKLIVHPLSEKYKEIKNTATLKDLLFIYDENYGAVLVSDNNTTPLSKGLNNLLKEFVLNKVSFISENKLLLGTVKNGTIIYEIDKKSIKIIDKISGLQNNTILGQKVKNNSIWLSLDNGVSKINIKNFNEFYKDFSGKLGAVYDIAFLKNKMYLASNTGLYTFKNKSLELVNNTEGHIWNLYTHKDDLLCAHNSGMKIFNNKKQIYDNAEMSGVYSLKKIPNKSDHFLLGTYIGISILKKTNNDKWSASIVKNIAFPVNNIEFESDSIIWITHPYKGLYRAKIDFTKNSITTLNSFTENNSLKDYKTNLYKVDDKLLFYNSNNYFTYSNANKTFVSYKGLDNIKNNDFISDDKGGNWFINENKEIAYKNKELEVNYTLNSTQIKERLVTGFEKIIVYNDSIRFLNLNDGFVKFIFQKSKDDLKNKVITPIIDKIYTQENELKINEFQIKVPFKESKLITMELYSPNEYENKIHFNLDGKIKYTGKSNNGKIELQNLSYGDYSLNLKSIDSIYQTKTLDLTITVLRPWYLSYWMFAVYSLILFVILLIIREFIKKKFKREQTKIHKELVLNTQKKINKIEKENLKNEIKTKKKVLATITESIIKKNEIIIILKNELIRIAKTYPEQYISQKLLKVANDSISNNRDWKVFEESFNDLHEDFLKKLVYQFPKLTSKDLKLCAYIKTGYTSKDIAPLLGITVRGIEIQRYRLRKKMSLPKDQSIFDFLISFE